METRASYVAAGTFIIGLLVGMVFFILWISEIDWTEGKLYDIYFSGSVTGLRENEVVAYNGVPIGRVDKISIDPRKLNLIKVTVEIDNPDLIRENSFATLEAKGITGSVQVRINGTTTNSPCLKAKEGETYPVIKSRVSAFQAVIDEAPIVMEKIVHLLEEIKPVFNEENRESISRSLQNLEKISNTLAEQRKDLKDIFKNTSEAVLGLKNASNQFNDFLSENRPNVKDFTSEGLPAASQTIKKVRSAAENIDQFLQGLSQGANQGEEYPE